MKYIVDDRNLTPGIFIPFVNQIWKGEYDQGKTEAALSHTLNITAYDGLRLVGCLRILTDGYFFGTITELLVLPLIPKARDWKPAFAAGQRAYADSAVLRSTAGCGGIL